MPWATRKVKSARKPSAGLLPRLLVTIDGPAGSGKSTTAKQLAHALGLSYLDTGATYRTLAYAAIQQDVVITDVEQLIELARRLSLGFVTTPAGRLRVMLDGQDISQAIRTEEVSEAAAHIAQYPGVRAAMVKRQRGLARAGGFVVEGRDTGSVVFPDAPYKFFLDASPQVRAHRRQRELARLYGSKPPLAQVQEQLHFRDGLDRTRRVGALVKPRGAVTIDTSHRTVRDVVRIMQQRIRQRERRRG